MNQPFMLVTQLELPLPASPVPGTKTFYVVLHGAFTLVENNEEWRAHMIEMGPDHQYTAGSWLSETHVISGLRVRLDLPPLRTDPAASLDPKSNPVLRLSAWPDPSHPAFRAVFTLPPPHAVHCFHRGPVTLVGDTSALVDPNPDTLTETRVLEYRLAAGADLENAKLLLPSAGEASEYWSCFRDTEWPGSEARKVASLHLFNIPMQTEVPPEHNREEFEKSAMALGVSGLTIAPPPASGPKQVPQPPPGLSAFELHGLRNRQELGDSLARFLRTGTFVAPGAQGGSCEGCCASPDGRKG